MPKGDTVANYDESAYCGHCGEYVPRDRLGVSSDGYPTCPECGRKVRLRPKFKKRRKKRK